MLTQSYPNYPGYKAAGPSKEAADKAAPKAPALRDQAVAILKQHHRLGLTADELAHLLNVSILSIRPRLTELAHMGVIEDSGARRENSFKSNVTVWRLK